MTDQPIFHASSPPTLVHSLLPPSSPSSPPPPPLPDQPFDVLIQGTGLKASLLAIALSRASLSVLQLDSASYYGGYEAGFFGLDEVENWAKDHEGPLKSKYGYCYARVEKGEQINAWNARRKRNYTLTLSPQLIYWFSPLLKLLRNVDMTGPFNWLVVGGWWVYLPPGHEERSREGEGGIRDALASAAVKAARAGMAVKEKKRGWNKGRSRKKQVAEEPISSVTRDDESQDEKNKNLDVGVTTDASSSSSASLLRTIPPRQKAPDCTAQTSSSTLRETPITFESIAWDPTLNDTHRTTLASFLRFALSYSSSVISPARSTSLQTFLMTTYPLPQSIIDQVHSLTLLPTPPSSTPICEALPRIVRHAQNLGKVPDVRSASALIIGYGGGSELCQVWSRGAAVAGAINVLERSIISLVERQEVESGRKKVQATLSTGEAINVDWIVAGEEELDSYVRGKPEKNDSQQEQEQRTMVQAKGIYIISSELARVFERKYPNEEKIFPGGTVITFPANSISLQDAGEITNKNPIYLLLRNSATEECPRGECLIYASTLISELNAREEENKDRASHHHHHYSLLTKAVNSLLEEFDFFISASDENATPSILFSLSYTHVSSFQSTASPTSSSPSSSRSVLIDPDDKHVLPLRSLSATLILDDYFISECADIYTHIMLSHLPPGENDKTKDEREKEIRESFMQLSEEMRRLAREMQDVEDDGDYN